MSYLKSKRASFAFGEIEITELSALAQIEMMEAKDKPFEGLFIACRHGAWPDKTVDELKRTLTLRIANEVAEAIFELSGVEAKNSETGTGAGSSSA